MPATLIHIMNKTDSVEGRTGVLSEITESHNIRSPCSQNDQYNTYRLGQDLKRKI